MLLGHQDVMVFQYLEGSISMTHTEYISEEWMNRAYHPDEST
jgi:hypothetical protein